MAFDEEHIACSVAKGDRSAFKELYDNSIRYLTAVCSRYISAQEDVHDILQDSYMDIFNKMQLFTYQGKGSLKAWMTRIVINKSLDFIKETARRQNTFLNEEIAHDIADDTEADAEQVPADIIMAMIRELPDGYRAVFNMFVIDNMSHAEIATRLGISENTSASQLHRAKALLAKKINEYRKKTL